jgi:hypothetical protein
MKTCNRYSDFKVGQHTRIMLAISVEYQYDNKGR